MKIYLNLIFFSLFTSLQNFAEVNVLYGEFKLSHSDNLNTTSDLLSKVLTRHYSSRSLRKGLFGYGWCQLLDYKITTIQEETIELSTCKETRKISSKNGHFHFDNLDFTFNSKKQIIAVSSKIELLKLSYDHLQRITHIEYQKTLLNKKTRDKKVLFEIKNHLLVSVNTLEHNDKLFLNYSYLNGKLNQVMSCNKSSPSNTCNSETLYNYDSNDNMIEWKNLTGDFEKMTYDEDLDLVTSYQQINRCTNYYDYSLLNKSKKVIQSRICPNKIKQKILYTYDSIFKTLKISIQNESKKIIGGKDDNNSTL